MPIMGIYNEEYLAIPDIIKAVNKGNEETLKKIYLSACHIGYNFEKIERGDPSGPYHSALAKSLHQGQTLTLVGDSFTGEIVKSLGARLEPVFKFITQPLNK